MTKKKFFLLGLFTILFFPLVSFVIHLFTKDFPFYIIFKSNSFIITELILGFLTGGGNCFIRLGNSKCQLS